MKLKTKFQDEDFELGEVTDVDIATMPDGSIKVQSRAKRGGQYTFFYKTKAAFDAEWEDALEEPKKHYEILGIGYVVERDNEDDIFRCARQREIGNYFETKEEAELAVEKLKAIKILRDNSFRFIQWEFDMKTIADGKIWFDVGVNTQWDAEQLLKHRPEVKESLDLLFGGEE